MNNSELKFEILKTIIFNHFGKINSNLLSLDKILTEGEFNKIEVTKKYFIDLNSFFNVKQNNNFKNF
ncbi:hypothetical protein [Mesoplasma coleopterae]|uniref:hypothetical protein n=1 Tax=Mesoplasma coleopterae TaxID=324078 RepID=UPI000D03D3D6|nr:hypothetical protein [Mesoplasma coleopterae]AVN62710.1 hypothetical protein CG000_00060 [Mesoplasma coleopterae]